MLAFELTPAQRDALRLAVRDCAGPYGLDHLTAWRDLERLSLVVHVETPDGLGRFYRATPAGLAVLNALDAAH